MTTPNTTITYPNRNIADSVVERLFKIAEKFNDHQTVSLFIDGLESYEAQFGLIHPYDSEVPRLMESVYDEAATTTEGTAYAQSQGDNHERQCNAEDGRQANAA